MNPAGKLRFAVVTGLLLLGSSKAAQHGPPPVVQPAVVLSPSGRLALRIDPSSRDGRGAASMRLERQGVSLWERDCDLTLVEARLFEDGSVAGCAYPPGELVLLFLGPAGLERARVSIPRETRKVHGLPVPNVIAVERRTQPDGVTVRLDSGAARHFSFDGTESATPIGLPAEAGLERESEVLPPPPERPLELLALPSVRLQFTPIEADRRGPLPRFVPRTGTILLNEFQGALHVFGADGRRTALCLPSPGEPTRYRPYAHLDLDPEGALHAYNGEVHLKFAPTGEQMSAEPVRSDQPAEHFLPSGGRWLREVHRLVLRRAGQEDLVVERAVSGRWFRLLACAAVASDGVLAVMDDGSEVWASDGNSEAVLQLFEPDGRARASLPFAPESKFYPLAARPGEVALLDEKPHEIRALATDGSRAGRARLPGWLTKPGPISYSPDGRELWVLDHELVLHRFELRWR